jgi:hypothetical protein
MAIKILLVFIILNFLFAACGGLLLAVVLMTRSSVQAAPTISNVAQNLLLDHCPLIGKISYPRVPWIYAYRVSFLQPLESMPSSSLPPLSSPYLPWSQLPIAQSSGFMVTPSSSALFSQC